MKLENLIDYSACHCRIGKPKLIFHDPFCISFLPVRHAVAQRNLVFSFNRFCTTKNVTFKLSYNIPFCNVEYKTKVIKESNFLFHHATFFLSWYFVYPIITLVIVAKAFDKDFVHYHSPFCKRMLTYHYTIQVIFA